MKKALSLICILALLFSVLSPSAFALDAQTEDPVIPPDVVNSVTYPYYTTTALNLRSGPGTSYSVITTIPSGTRVRLSTYRDGWGYITYSNYTGYVSMDYLIGAASVRSVNRYAGTALRSTASSVGSVIGTLNVGTVMQYLSSVNSSWYRVKVLSGSYAGSTGYVASSDVAAVSTS